MGVDVGLLYSAVDEVKDLLPRLHGLIADADSVLESSIGSHRKRPVAPIPWNDAVAFLLLEVHGNARSHEQWLSLLLFGLATYRAPGSDAQTFAALDRLPDLVLAALNAGIPVDAWREVPADLLAWPKRIRVMLDEAQSGDEPPAKAPSGVACPHCGRRLLLTDGWEYQASASTIDARCPSCVHDDGSQMSWPVTKFLGRLQDESLVSAADARARYGLNPSTLRSWHHRGKVHPRGVDELGRPLYRVVDVLALLDVQDSNERAGADA